MTVNLQQALADKIRQKLKSGELKLPALPDTVLKVRAIIDDESKGAMDISKVLSEDATFSTVVFRLANSARFNTSGHEIRSLSMAVQRIGARRILHLLISIASKMFMHVSQPELRALLKETHDRSLLIATAAQHLARMTAKADPEEAFMAGLLHDEGIGALISGIPEKLVACPAETRRPLLELLHREMGARLLNHWGLPNIYILTAMHHGIESSSRPREPLIDCVDVAEFLTRRISQDKQAAAPEASSEFPPCVRLRLSDAQLIAVEMEVEDSIEELREIFDMEA